MTCAGLVLLAAAAQVPPPGMAPDLWRHMQGWEAVVAGTTSLVSDRGTKTVTDNLSGRTTIYDADIWFFKPNLLRLRLDRQLPAGQKPDPYEFQSYVFTSRSVFEYDGSVRDLSGKRTPTVTEYPRDFFGLVGDHPLLEVMSGRMTARQIAERYAIQWQRPDDPTYLIWDFTPRLPTDKREFVSMTLVLIRPGLTPPLNQLAYVPRLAKIVKPNANVVETWDFPEPRRNPVKPDGQPIGPADFRYVDPGAGWRVELLRRREVAPPPRPVG